MCHVLKYVLVVEGQTLIHFFDGLVRSPYFGDVPTKDKESFVKDGGCNKKDRGMPMLNVSIAKWNDKLKGLAYRTGNGF